MAWCKKEKKARQPRRERLEIPADVWEKCEACQHTDIREKFERNMNVCPNCDYHRRIRATDYCNLLLDEGTMEEVEVDLRSTDPLGFPEYPARLKKNLDNAGDTDALLACTGTLDSLPVNLGVMDFAFMGGSMGSVVGEKIARLGQRSLERKYPLIIVSASGGARMQEGVLSLMQMAKVAAVLAQLAERRIPYISILTNPDDGRRQRQLRDARRRDSRRARRGHRIRRPARDQADARSGSPRRISDGRVPARPRDARPVCTGGI